MAKKPEEENKIAPCQKNREAQKSKGEEKRGGHDKGSSEEEEDEAGEAVKWNKDVSIEDLLDGSYDEEGK